MPYGISILYNILEMNVMFFFANPTKALCIPTPEGVGFYGVFDNQNVVG